MNALVVHTLVNAKWVIHTQYRNVTISSLQTIHGTVSTITAFLSAGGETLLIFLILCCLSLSSSFFSFFFSHLFISSLFFLFFAFLVATYTCTVCYAVQNTIELGYSRLINRLPHSHRGESTISLPLRYYY